MADSSSNSNSASDFVSSVFPVPVGPRKKNEPIGFLGSLSPLRDSIMASDKVVIARFCPFDPFLQFALDAQKSVLLAGLCIFPIGILVHSATIASISEERISSIDWSDSAFNSLMMPDKRPAFIAMSSSLSHT